MSLANKKNIKGLNRRRSVKLSNNVLGFTPLAISDFSIYYHQLFGYGLVKTSWSGCMYYCGLMAWCGLSQRKASDVMGWPHNTGFCAAVEHRRRLGSFNYWRDWARLCELCEGFISPIEGYKGRKRVKWDTFLPPCPEKKSKK